MKNIMAIIAVALRDAASKFTGMTWAMDLEGEELAEYEAAVRKSAEAANVAAGSAYMILIRGNQRELPEATEHVREAAELEWQWGDAPSYGPVLKALEELNELLED